MKQSQYRREFSSFDSAVESLITKQQVTRNNDLFAIMPLENNRFAVVDLMTAIKTGNGYLFNVNRMVTNPWDWAIDADHIS